MTIQEYVVKGMTCEGCKHKVQSLLEDIAGKGNVSVDLASGKVKIRSPQVLPIQDLKAALVKYPQYLIDEELKYSETAVEQSSDERTWFQKYRPILILFSFILLVSIIAGAGTDGFDSMLAMRIFMSGFFLAFSFFKFLDLKGFATSYAMYDIVAKVFPSWGYIYAFIEFLLGLAFAANFMLEVTLWITLVVMSVSIIGVLQSVLNKRKIQCACLGVVFDLPMSTVTVIEDALMIAMSVWMLVVAF